MLHKIIYGKLYYEKVLLPFDCMSILTNEECPEGFLSSHGSFHFNFALKDSDSLIIERLISDKDKWKKYFMKRFLLLVIHLMDF